MSAQGSGALRRQQTGRCLSQEEEAQVLQRNLEEQWDKADINRDGYMDRCELRVLLTMEVQSQRVSPSVEVCDELMARMAGSGATHVTKPEFLKYLTDLKDQVAHDPRDLDETRSSSGRWSVQSMLMRNSKDMGSTSFAESEESEETSCSESSAEETFHETPAAKGRLKRKLHRDTPGHFKQLRIIMCRTLIQWWRQNRTRSIYFVAMGAGAIVLAVQDAVTQVPKWDAQNYVNTHTCVGLLTAIFCLNVFGQDQPVFWRERNRGLNVLSFFIGRTYINAIDLVMQTYLFTALYFLLGGFKVHFFLFWFPFLLVAFAASGWGYLVSTLLPPQHGPFVVSLITFVICGLLGNPQSLAKFLDSSMGPFVSLISITRWSIPMSFDMQIEHTNPEPHGQQESMLLPFYKSTLQGRGFAGMGDWWSGVCALTAMGLVLRLLALLGLMFGNRSKQV